MLRNIQALVHRAGLLAHLREQRRRQPVLGAGGLRGRLHGAVVAETDVGRLLLDGARRRALAGGALPEHLLLRHHNLLHNLNLNSINLKNMHL